VIIELRLSPDQRRINPCPPAGVLSNDKPWTVGRATAAPREPADVRHLGVGQGRDLEKSGERVEPANRCFQSDLLGDVVRDVGFEELQPPLRFRLRRDGRKRAPAQSVVAAKVITQLGCRRGKKRRLTTRAARRFACSRRSQRALDPVRAHRSRRPCRWCRQEERARRRAQQAWADHRQFRSQFLW
jgi:hypothetical protein